MRAGVSSPGAWRALIVGRSRGRATRRPGRSEAASASAPSTSGCTGIRVRRTKLGHSSVVNAMTTTGRALLSPLPPG